MAPFRLTLAAPLAGPCCGYSRRVSRPAGREQNWYPVSQVSWFTGPYPGGRRGYPTPAGAAPARPGPAAQRAGVAAYEKLLAELRKINSEVLAAAAELSHGTIETVLARSDLQLGAEALLRRPGA
jgi:hypothetical protein